ncbi:MAG: hypothetical protein DHS20C15_12700 [Planctomycetota bacterium]|nr:MAG: hypothetical protein DHS20C15_12700 [Planctomycetota bacterium]
MIPSFCLRFALLAAVAAPLSAQSPSTPPATQPPPALDDSAVQAKSNAPGMRATINGHAITAHDVLVEARAKMLMEGASTVDVESPPAEQLQEALANSAREILLTAEAKRLGLEISEYELDELMRQFYGQVPDLDLLATLTGTSAEFQRDRMRRQITAALYTRHRLGLDFRYSHLIPADPRLKRLVEVRPEELKVEFERRREQLALPARAHYLIYAFDDRDAAARGIEALEHGREALSTRQPLDETLSIDVIPERFAGLALAEWTLEAPAGAVSDAVVISQTAPSADGANGPPVEKPLFLVVHMLERLPGRAADFALDQALLMRTLRDENTERARRALVLEEARKAVVWPPDLF